MQPIHPHSNSKSAAAVTVVGRPWYHVVKFLKTTLDSNSPHPLFPYTSTTDSANYARRASSLSILVLNAALALVVDERTAYRLAGASTTEESSASGSTTSTCASSGCSGVLAASKSTSEEQHACCQEHGGPCTPGETEGVSANVGVEISIGEAVAGLDEGYPTIC